MIPIEDASARKREIEEKLKQEQETLSFIRENLEKSDQLTKGMVSILSSFESRLMQLENSIIPVHKQTENLQRLQENVDKTLSCMDHVISYYHVGKELLEVQEEVVLEHLPEAVLQDIICITGWLVEFGRNQDFMNVYFQIRSNQLDRSIKGLKEHFRKNSASSGVLYSPAVQTKRKDTPTKKVPKRPGKDDVLDIEIDSYIHCISAFVKLAQSEYALLTEIIPEHHQKKTFDSLIQEALDNLMLEGDNIVSAARRAIMRHDYSAVLTIFPILRHLKMNKSDFDSTLQVGSAASHFWKKLPKHWKKYNMPKDGTVHELTSNAILFLQQLLDFHETAGAMLASQESSSATSYSSDFNKRLLSSYICKVLGNLQLNLLSKSKVYEDSALSAIFLHNNYNYILKSLEKSELIQLVTVTQKRAEASYKELIQQQIEFYQRSWLKVTEHLTDRNMPVLQPGMKLKDKERQVIKEKFKGFNDGLEELCKIQKGTHPSSSLICGGNPEKYHKYRPEEVEEMIEKLFDTSA
uniref:Exocyst complex component 7 n=1 Tax=Oryzias latipes TaxID=8090 RepID=A0A3B3H9B5_ORYLA